jgi:hypothetical protein
MNRAKKEDSMTPDANSCIEMLRKFGQDRLKESFEEIRAGFSRNKSA